MVTTTLADTGDGDDNDADAEGAFVTCSWQGFFRDIAIPDRFVRSLPFASVPLYSLRRLLAAVLRMGVGRFQLPEFHRLP